MDTFVLQRQGRQLIALCASTFKNFKGSLRMNVPLCLTIILPKGEPTEPLVKSM